MPPRSTNPLFSTAAAAGFLVLLLLTVQILVFVLAGPPPATASETFSLLQQDPLVGLLRLDLLLLLDWVLLVPFWLALYFALRPTAPARALLAVTLALLATATYLASNPAIDLLALGARHAEAPTEAERASLISAGEALLVSFNGTAFTVSYLLSGAASLLGSHAMLTSPSFGKAAGTLGIAYGLLQAVPPNVGPVGLTFSLASLLPMVAWIALVAWKLRRATAVTPT